MGNVSRTQCFQDEVVDGGRNLFSILLNFLQGPERPRGGEPVHPRLDQPRQPPFTQPLLLPVFPSPYRQRLAQLDGDGRRVRLLLAAGGRVRAVEDVAPKLHAHRAAVGVARLVGDAGHLDVERADGERGRPRIVGQEEGAEVVFKVATSEKNGTKKFQICCLDLFNNLVDTIDYRCVDKHFWLSAH